MQNLETIKTPCFILDTAELNRSVEGFKAALAGRFAHFVLGYSVKTNSLPYCLCAVQKLGCWAEVVSAEEYELALACGFAKSQIIYNGPLKSRETFLDAMAGGATVNIETHRELAWLKELSAGGNYGVGLRLNVNISKISPQDAHGADDNSRFGFSDETDEFKKAVLAIDALPNVRLAGLHIHRTSGTRSIGFYKNAIKFACESIRKYGLQLDYIDIGGGFFGIFKDKPTYREYADAFKEALAEYGLDNLCVVVEPGNALVASCFSFLSEVIDVKHIDSDRWFLTTDGSRNDIDPFYRKDTYMTELLSDRSGQMAEEQIVSGCTCLEQDRLFTIKNQPLMKAGDRILYNNVGAYTMTLSPLFIRYLPRVYAWDGSDYRLVREEWTAKDYLNKSIL